MCDSRPCIFTGKVGGWIEYEDEGEIPVKIESLSWNNKPEIFLSLASYRDRLCPRTLYNAMTKAGNPESLKIGVVQQNKDDEDIDCLQGYCDMIKRMKPDLIDPNNVDCPFKNNIIMRRIKSTDAKGPVFARALGSEMIPDNSEFCMQVDSHMDFYPAWDQEMLKMWSLTNNEYAVVSTYVNDLSTYNAEVNGNGVNDRHEVPHLCMITFQGQGGMVRNWGTKCLMNFDKPKLTNAVWGAGLSFSKCHAEKKVPYDPNLPFVFDGEEFSKAARLWTYGYDIYSPHRVFVFHDYHSSQSDHNHFGWSMNSFSSNKNLRGKHINNNLIKNNNESMWLSGAPEIPSSPVNIFTMAGAHNRLRNLLEMQRGINNITARLEIQYHRFGLGDRRSLDQLIEFSGINTRTSKGGQIPGKCGNLKYVPFTPHPQGADHIPSFDELGRPLEDPDEGSIYYGNDIANRIRTLAKNMHITKSSQSNINNLNKHEKIIKDSINNVFTLQQIKEDAIDYHKDSHWGLIIKDILGLLLFLGVVLFTFTRFLRKKSLKALN